MSDLTKYAKGKRMVREDLIKQITENKEEIADIILNELKIKEGAGIVIDTDETDNSKVIMVDQESVPFKVDFGANPPLEGTEDELGSIKLLGTNYKIGGGDLYLHKISLHNTYNDIELNIYSPKATAYTEAELNSMTYEASDYRYYPHLLATYFTGNGSSSIKINQISSGTKTIYYKDQNNNSSALNFTYTNLVDLIFKL